ncbi:hypothetical protein AX774_g5308 [Zancudomyces culisetae]|uniref:Uncharacterized protein n=1 Tax=Zancudomyces culisetae TaxID=1213189 RepID=A0A1R1PJU0_ZANCU|nr:hypothetical protein AX774_g5308 [Zancudomyces culisetae]|eukprot:OMH81240.1 hypothetical protein AX774_g5308 [Zancudomyces culisetae]
MNDNGFVWNDCPYITFWNHNKKESQKLKVGIETKVLLDGIVMKKSRFDPVFFQDDKINITVKLILTVK